MHWIIETREMLDRNDFSKQSVASFAIGKTNQPVAVNKKGEWLTCDLSIQQLQKIIIQPY